MHKTTSRNDSVWCHLNTHTTVCTYTHICRISVRTRMKCVIGVESRQISPTRQMVKRTEMPDQIHFTRTMNHKLCWPVNLCMVSMTISNALFGTQTKLSHNEFYWCESSLFFFLLIVCLSLLKKKWHDHVTIWIWNLPNIAQWKKHIKYAERIEYNKYTHEADLIHCKLTEWYRIIEYILIHNGLSSNKWGV